VKRARAASILLLCALLAGCGKTARKTTTPATTGAATRSLQVYYLRGNALAPVTVSVAQTQAVATAALQKLLAGTPPPGYRTAIPPGTQLQSVAVSGGRATVRLSSDRLTHSAQAQIVYTLTQFPTVRAVDGGPFGVPASRSAFTDLTPQSPIFVAAPQRDSAASSPVHAHGTADVFEGTLAVDVWSGGRRVRTQTIEATSGTGTRGTWSATIPVPSGPAKLVFYEPSAENGQPLHATTVLLTVR
jgi:Sporulation and spore germination/Immunoglobulin-like domain of bacterial spore germination